MTDLLRTRFACMHCAAITFVVLSLLPVAAVADDYAQRIDVLDTTETVIGQPLEWPAGQARVISAVVTVPPGESTARHIHDVPLYGYVLEGELELDYGEHGVVSFSAGEALIEAIDVPHTGTNTGDGPLRILVVFMASEDSRNYVEVD